MSKCASKFITLQKLKLCPGCCLVERESRASILDCVSIGKPKLSFPFVDEVDTMRLLGVTFDRHLSYSPHLRSTAVRAAQRIGFLRLSLHASISTTMAGLSLIKASFSQPVLEYCPLVWPGAAACHLERLDKVQKRALSLIGAETINDSLALRRTVSALCLLYKLLSSPRLTTLQPLLPAQLTPVDNPRTRHQLSESHSFRLSP